MPPGQAGPGPEAAFPSPGRPTCSAAPHTGSSIVPFHREPCPSPQSQRSVLAGRLWRCRHQHPAVTGQAGPPDHGQAAVRGSSAPPPRLRIAGLWGKGLGAQRAKLWNRFDVLGMMPGAGWGGEGPRLAHLPHSLITLLPARPQAIQLYRREDKGQGRAGQTPWGVGRGLAPLSGFSSSWLEDGCLELGNGGCRGGQGVRRKREQQQQHM